MTSSVPPVIALGPVQLGSPPLVAVQLVAFPLPQVSVLDPPWAMIEMSAISEGDGDAPTVLVHTTCGHPLDQQFVCWDCDETFTQYDIASRPGLGTAEPTTDPTSHDSDTSDTLTPAHGEHS